MTYEDLKNSTLKAIDLWLDSLLKDGKNPKTDSLHGNAQAAVIEWKAYFPNKTKAIDEVVNDRMYMRFSRIS